MIKVDNEVVVTLLPGRVQLLSPVTCGPRSPKCRCLQANGCNLALATLRLAVSADTGGLRRTARHVVTPVRFLCAGEDDESITCCLEPCVARTANLHEARADGTHHERETVTLWPCCVQN